MAVPYKSTTAIPARNIEITPRPRSIVGQARSSMNLAIVPDPSHVIHGKGSKSSRKVGVLLPYTSSGGEMALARRHLFIERLPPHDSSLLALRFHWTK